MLKQSAAYPNCPGKLNIKITFTVLFIYGSVILQKRYSSACIKGSLGVRDSQNCFGTSKNKCQEVWDSQLLKIFEAILSFITKI